MTEAGAETSPAVTAPRHRALAALSVAALATVLFTTGWQWWLAHRLWSLLADTGIVVGNNIAVGTVVAVAAAGGFAVVLFRDVASLWQGTANRPMSIIAGLPVMAAVTFATTWAPSTMRATVEMAGVTLAVLAAVLVAAKTPRGPVGLGAVGAVIAAAAAPYMLSLGVEAQYDTVVAAIGERSTDDEVAALFTQGGRYDYTVANLSQTPGELRTSATGSFDFDGCDETGTGYMAGAERQHRRTDSVFYSRIDGVWVRDDTHDQTVSVGGPFIFSLTLSSEVARTNEIGVCMGLRGLAHVTHLDGSRSGPDGRIVYMLSFDAEATQAGIDRRRWEVLTEIVGAPAPLDLSLYATGRATFDGVISSMPAVELTTEADGTLVELRPVRLRADGDDTFETITFMPRTAPVDASVEGERVENRTPTLAEWVGGD